jgi:uridine kinase
MEIERRFLVDKFPTGVDVSAKQNIKQYYISGGTEESRVRSIDKNFYLTVKAGKGLSREENELPVSKDIFDALATTSIGMLDKARYIINDGADKIELNVFNDELSGLMLAEVEFKSKEDSTHFVPPPWIGKEVTEDQRYNGFSLAVNGMPPDLQISARKSYSKLSANLDKIMEMLDEKRSGSDRPVTIEISGGSASGKTSLAKMLQQKLGNDAVTISMDDYYRGVSYMKEQKEKGMDLNFDQPEVIDMDLLHKNLEDLKNGKMVDKPVYSFKTGERLKETERIAPVRFVILEGLFALSDELSTLGDIRIFVDASAHSRLIRKLFRDVARTSWPPSKSLKYGITVVEPMYAKYILPTKKNATMIISNEYDPYVESTKLESQEYQLKFKSDNLVQYHESIRKGGGKLISVSTQTDRFYGQRGRMTSFEDEILRLREESGRYFITYKGPKTESTHSRRYIFDLEVDAAFGGYLSQIYGSEFMKISKRRAVYMVEDALVCVDADVTKEKDGATKNLGDFIELQFPDKENITAKISKIKALLTLSDRNQFTYSYGEM